MLRITHKDGRTVELPDKLLPNVCLQIAGGGWTSKQTAEAMRLQAELNEYGTVKFKSVTLTLGK